MPTYKLVYFNSKGRAEPCRWLFALAGVEYEDFRFDSDQWAAIKPTSPFSQAPFLEVDGVMICQSIAMARYLGTEFGFVGSTSLEKARGDMIADSINDLIAPLLAMFGEQDDEKKKQLGETFSKDKAPSILADFEKVLCQNAGGDGFFVGDKITWTDIYVVTHIQGIQVYGASKGVDLQMDKYPKLNSLVTRVQEIPAIAEWIKKRPVTES